MSRPSINNDSYAFCETDQGKELWRWSAMLKRQRVISDKVYKTERLALKAAGKWLAKFDQ